MIKIMKLNSLLGLKDQIRKVCQEEFLVCGEGEEQGGAWMEKVNRHFYNNSINRPQKLAY